MDAIHHFAIAFWAKYCIICEGRPFNKKEQKNSKSKPPFLIKKKITNLYLLLFLSSLCPIFSTEKIG